MARVQPGSERLADQGLSPQQSESSDTAIRALLLDPVVGDQVDQIIAYRRGPDTNPRAGR